MITLTPNRRLSANQLKKNQAEQILLNKKCWNTPVILPFSSWLETLWHEYTTKNFDHFPLVLSADQELILWEDIISQSKDSEHLMQISETAELAKAAFGLLKQYQVPLTHPKLDTTEDSGVFLKWAHLFQQHCFKMHCIDQNSLTDLIAEKIAAHEIAVPDHINLFGFTEICSQHQALLTVCEQQGTSITHLHTDIEPDTLSRMHFADPETEIRAMAIAAKTAYEKNPTAKIGCVVPNLEDKREMILRIFSEVFTPIGFYTTKALNLPFNVSAGKNLAAYPVIRTALTLLALQSETLTLEKLSNILHSPFLGDAESEMLNRAAFTNQLYRANIANFSLQDLISTDKRPNLSLFSPKLTKRLQQFLEKIPGENKKQSISAWANTFMEWLALLGWPGERSTSSEEHQSIERWLKLINQFKKLDSVLPVQTGTRALHYLNRLTKNDVFQPESPETSIQILGMLEAAEIPFETLWITGMDDTTWPPAPKPNPFIPLHLQKTLNMPHASPERELQFCVAILNQLKKSAHHVIVSSALQNDETELRPSALIETIPEVAYPYSLDIYETKRAANFIFKHKKTEMLFDHLAPSVTEPENISGGTKIFELQAACPFRAFSEIRLYAKPIDRLTPGLRATDRGVIIHKILEILWQEIKDSETLHALSQDELNASISSAIQKTLKQYVLQKTDSTRYLKLEALRLTKIISDWMLLEKSRPKFKVFSQEQEYRIHVGTIPVTLRIDRIDEIENHAKIIIDYKTGKNIDIKNCFGARPDALQLPLYCIIDPENTVAIAYAKINPEKMQLDGVSQSDLTISSIKAIADIKFSDASLWSEQLAQWKQTLEKLSQDFCNGNAEVDPKEMEKTCEYCQLKPLCRIDEKHDA